MAIKANSMMNKLGGVPLCLVVLAVAAESFFGDVADFGEVPLVEMLIVAIAAPLALYFAKKRSSSVAKPAVLKAVQADKKLAPWRQASSTHGVQQESQKRSSNAITEKTRLDSFLKEGNLEA